MSNLTKLKNAINKNVPSFYVRQEVSLPIFTFDLKHEVSAEAVFNKAVQYQKNIEENNKKMLVKEGYQTPYFMERFLFTELISVIEKKASLVFNSNYKMNLFWFVFYSNGTSHELHNHLNKNRLEKYPISASYYPKIGSNPSPIVFQTKSIYNEISEISIPVKENMLVLFHSELKHYVPLHSSDEPRVVFSCNLSEK